MKTILSENDSTSNNEEPLYGWDEENKSLVLKPKPDELPQYIDEGQAASAAEIKVLGMVFLAAVIILALIVVPKKLMDYAIELSQAGLPAIVTFVMIVSGLAYIGIIIVKTVKNGGRNE